MVLEPGADDLPLVVEVLRPDEADDAVDQEWVERPRHAVGPGLERELVDAMVGAGRQGTPLPRLEVHRLLADPGDIPASVMLAHAMMTLAEERQVDPEGRVGRLGTGDRLEQQVDRRAAVEAAELGRDVGQAAGLRGDLQRIDEAVERAEDGLGDVDRLGGRIDADHRIAAAVEQAVGGRQEDAAQVVAGVIRLDADAQDAAPAHRVAATGYYPDLARGQDQVLVAHQLGRRRYHFRSQSGLDRGQRLAGRGVVENPVAERADGQAAEGLEGVGVERFADQPANLVGVRIDQRMVDDLAERQFSQDELGRHALALAPRGDPGELVARLLLIGRGEDRAQVGEGKPLASNDGRQVHGSVPCSSAPWRQQSHIMRRS